MNQINVRVEELLAKVTVNPGSGEQVTAEAEVLDGELNELTQRLTELESRLQ